MIFIGDVHGCYRTLKHLISKKLPNDRKICFLGDLIDRGPESYNVVSFVERLINKGKAVCLKGNHEDMAIQWFDNQDTNDDWIHNGGLSTLNSFGIDLYNLKNVNRFTMERFKIYIQWFKSLPVKLEFPDIKVVATHAPYPEFHADNPFWLMWNRNFSKPPVGWFNVHGHNPTPQVQITENYANIDTGCVYGTKAYNRIEYGTLTALLMPEKEIIQVKCVD